MDAARRLRRSLLALPLLVACSGDSSGDAEAGEGDTGDTGSVDPNTFPEPGSLVTDEGRNSFRFGVASAAAQIEDENTNTDWYWFTLPDGEGGVGTGTPVGDASRGWTKMFDDIALYQELGLDSYRFSISWARVEPQRDVIDEDAVQRYSDFIDALLEAGIQPMITVHHFSNPVWVDDPRDTLCENGPTDENLCGFEHPEGGPMIVEEMGEHAALLAERFGDRVDEWATVNEPINYLVASHGVGVFPPGKNDIFQFEELFLPAIRSFLLGHAAMYHAIKDADTVDADGDGNPADVGLTLNAVQWVAARDNEISTEPQDVAAKERIDYVYLYFLPESILGGTFDADFDGEPDEDLPEIEGTMDWLGVQYYNRAGVTAGPPSVIPVVGVTPCFDTVDFGSCIPPLDQTYCVPAMRYEQDPGGLYDILAGYHERWPEVPMVITENGTATEVEARRGEVIVRSLEQIGRARSEGMDVRGYYHWTPFDNFEWAEGYEPRFGLYRVDFNGDYSRTPTEGATVMQQITATRSLSEELRAQYGGDGPMTPEPGAVELCKVDE